MNKQDIKIQNPDILSGQTLAYLGDAAYELRIRRYLIETGIVRPQKLHYTATHFVSAKAQAALVSKLLDENLLSDKEIEIFKRGRNAKVYTHAKHTNLITYKYSTGFEAMIGFLALNNETARVDELCNWCIDQVEQGGIADVRFE